MPATPVRSAGCSSATPTSTTRSTRPAIARRYSAKAYGSASLVQLMRLHGLGRLGRRGRAAPALRARPLQRPLHPQPPLEAAARPQGPDGRRADLRSPRTACRRPPTGAGRSGGSGSRSRASASTTRAAPTSTTNELPDDPVDVFLAGVAGRSVTPRYWERILPRLDPRARRPDPLRRLLRAARPRSEADSPRRPGGRSRRGLGGLTRRPGRCAAAGRRAAAVGLTQEPGSCASAAGLGVDPR